MVAGVLRLHTKHVWIHMESVNVRDFVEMKRFPIVIKDWSFQLGIIYEKLTDSRRKAP